MRRSSGSILSAMALLLFSAAAHSQTVLWDTLRANSAIAFSSQGNGTIPTEAADDFIVNSSQYSNGFVLKNISFMGLLSDTNATLNAVSVKLYQEFPFNSDTTRTPPFTRANGPGDVEFAAFNFAPGQFTETKLGSFAVSQTITPGSATQFGAVGAGLTGDLRQIDLTLPSPLFLGPTDPNFTTHINHYWLAISADTSAGNYYWVSGARPPVFPNPPPVDRQTWLNTAAFDPDWRRVSDIVNSSNNTTSPAYNAAFRVSGAASTPEPGSLALAGTGVLCLLALRRRKR